MKRRPLDKFLEPLSKKLNLRASLYKEPDSATEQAVLTVEQARSARDPKFKATLLMRAAHMLERPEGEAAPEVLTLEEQMEEQARVMIWSEITQMASKLKMIELSQQAATAVLDREWNPGQFKEIVMVQAKAHFTVAEALLGRLKVQKDEAMRLMEESSAETKRVDANIYKLGLGVGSEPGPMGMKTSERPHRTAALTRPLVRCSTPSVR